MGMFGKFTKNAKHAGTSITTAAGKAGSSVVVASEERSNILSLRSQINIINQELTSAYTQIGRKYVEQAVKTDETPVIVDVSDIMELIIPKMEKRQSLEQEIIQLEKEINQKNILRERAEADRKFDEEKQKLDKALALELITESEYDEKLASALRRLDNFDAIRKVNQQYDMGLITSDEKKMRIEILTGLEQEIAE